MATTKKDLPAPVVFCFFSTFQWPVHLVYKCCYCDHNAYFCVVEMIVMIVFFNPSTPPPLPVLILLSVFLVESWKRCAKSFCFKRLWIVTELVHFGYVRACACVCVRPTVLCCSWCVVVSVTLRYFSLWLSDPMLSPLSPSICHTPLPSTLLSIHSWGCRLVQGSSKAPMTWSVYNQRKHKG